jgi:hypothetical protein
MKSLFAIAVVGFAFPVFAQDVYTNDLLGVKVRSAPGWKFISETERQSALESTTLKTQGLKEFIRANMSKPFLVITRPRSRSPQPTITVLVAPLDSGMTKDPIKNLKSTAVSGERAFEDYRIVEEPRNVKIGGRNGAHVKATYSLTTKTVNAFPPLLRRGTQ